MPSQDVSDLSAIGSWSRIRLEDAVRCGQKVAQRAAEDVAEIVEYKRRWLDAEDRIVALSAQSSTNRPDLRSDLTNVRQQSADVEHAVSALLAERDELRDKLLGERAQAQVDMTSISDEANNLRVNLQVFETQYAKLAGRFNDLKMRTGSQVPTESEKPCLDGQVPPEMSSALNSEHDQAVPDRTQDLNISTEVQNPPVESLSSQSALQPSANSKGAKRPGEMDKCDDLSNFKRSKLAVSSPQDSLAAKVASSDENMTSQDQPATGGDEPILTLDEVDQRLDELLTALLSEGVQRGSLRKDQEGDVSAAQYRSIDERIKAINERITAIKEEGKRYNLIKEKLLAK